MPLGFLFALPVGRALACGDLVEGAPLRFHPHMGVAGKHGTQDAATWRAILPGGKQIDYSVQRNRGWFRVLLQPAAVRTPNRGARGPGATGAPLCGSGPVAVPMGNLVAVGCRRGEKSIPVKGLPVAAHARKAPQASASANSATSAFGCYFLPAGGAEGAFCLAPLISTLIWLGLPDGCGCTSIGIGADAAGTVCTGAGAFPVTGAAFSGVVSRTEVPSPAVRVARIDNESEVTMNRTAEIVVAFESNVADPRGPNAVCEPIPPNAPARSAAFPLCSSTTMIRKTHTTT